MSDTIIVFSNRRSYAEHLIDVAQQIHAGGKIVEVEACDQGMDGALSRIAMAFAFTKKQNKGLVLRALFEEWTAEELVREMY